MKIDKLIGLISKHFVFDETVYPELKGADEQYRLRFAIRHSALHFAKTAGKIAAVSEDVDHGGELNTEALKVDVVKSLISVLRLAELLGLTETDLIAGIEHKYNDTIE